MRYIGFLAMWAVVKAVSFYTLIWGLLVLLTQTSGVPRSVLLIGENEFPTGHPLILSADEDNSTWGTIADCIDQLKVAIETNDVESGRMLLIDAVKDFHPQCDAADLVQEKLTRVTDKTTKGKILNYPS